jgi:hypothetical protein
MTKVRSYDITRILRELNKLSRQEKLLIIGAVYCSSHGPETVRGLVSRSVENPSKDFTDAVNEICCLEKAELTDLTKTLAFVYFH